MTKKIIHVQPRKGRRHKQVITPRFNKYFTRSYYTELSALRANEIGCCGFFANEKLIKELGEKMRLCLENKEKLRDKTITQQRIFIESLHHTNQLGIKSNNFSDDPDGKLADELQHELNEYINNADRKLRDDKIQCEWKDEKNKKQTFVNAGITRQRLFKELQDNLKERTMQKSLSDIIKQWKEKLTQYKKPNENIYYTNYELASIKTGWSEPHAKKLIDTYEARLLAATNAPKL